MTTPTPSPVPVRPGRALASLASPVTALENVEVPGGFQLAVVVQYVVLDGDGEVVATTTDPSGVGQLTLYPGYYDVGSMDAFMAAAVQAAAGDPSLQVFLL